jgi:phosphoglycerate dehydrogenase-like enzyme
MSIARCIRFALVLLLAGPLPLSASSLQEEKARLSVSAVDSMIETLGLRESTTPSRQLPGWSPPAKIVVRLNDADRLEMLQLVAPETEIVAVQSVTEAVAAVGDAQVLIGFCDQAILEAGTQLHWVQVYSAGVDRCVDNPGFQEGDKLLTNGQRISSPALADSAVAMMMALMRGLDVYGRNQQKREWNRNPDMGKGRPVELEGRTVLVVGLGGIGTQVARRAHGLGMRVTATRGSRREGPDYVDYVGLADETLQLAGSADVVINTAPLTDRTRGMFDADFFAAMKPSAYFISVGRGASTVTEDLVQALKSGELAGAGLDVTDPEPLPEDSELWALPRVIITPHVAGRSERGRERLYLLVQENLRRYVAGEPMLSVVDIRAGY